MERLQTKMRNSVLHNMYNSCALNVWENPVWIFWKRSKSRRNIPCIRNCLKARVKRFDTHFFFLILTWLMICLILPSGILIISLFQKWLIVLLSLLQKVEQPENSVQMLRVTDNTGHRTSMKEIGNALDRSKLDSNDVIIVSAPKSIWVWIGKGKLNFC